MTTEYGADTIVDEESEYQQIEQNNLSDDLLMSNSDKRFKLIRPLGNGGTSSVFLAYDEQLQRDVAIKMLTKSKLDQTLLFEARIQAQIDHPNICKIFQVEEANNHNEHGYIVMQYIEGMSALKWLKIKGGIIDSLSVIELMQKVCDGLQTLHAQGIIHRDIKPENIMLAEDEQFGLQPYVVDFGLANSGVTDKNRINSKGIAGTPAYMSPEQFQNAKLDTRSDVYSIGATLYLLLTGARPVPADTPKAVNRFDHPNWHALPQDLQVIVRKCMNEQREKRYQSARELNQELQLFLAGEPIKTIKTKRYWLKKKLLKYKWQAMLYATVTIGILTSVVWQQYQIHQQQKREQLIAQFSSKVENLDASVRLSKMTIPHDVSAEIKQWQQQIEQIKTELKNVGEIGFGPGHYAIGTMHYTLQQYDKALEHLQLAWDSGFNQPRVAYNLALSHGAIYQRQKSIINNIRNRSARKDKMLQLDKNHRQPAIDLLKQGLQDSPFQSFTQALLHYYQEEFQQALDTLGSAQDLPSWFYQHHVLRGDIFLTKAEKVGAAHKNEQVQYYAKRAIDSYDKAATMGRSDIQLKLKPLNIYFRLLNNINYGKPGDFNGIYNQAMATLADAAIINPNHYQIFAYKGRLYALKRKYHEQHPGDPLIASKKEIENFKQALALDENNTDLQVALGMAYTARIKLLDHQQLPSEHLFELATASFAKVPEEQKDYTFYNYFGVLNHQIATYKAKQTANTSLSESLTINQNQNQNDSYFNNAVTTYQNAITKNPNAIGAYVNLGVVYRDWSHLVDLENSAQKFDLAIEQLQTALTLNQDHFTVNFYFAQSYNNLSRINNYLLQPIEQNLKQAQTYLNKTKQLHPTHPSVILESVNLNTFIAVNNWQNGCDHNPWFTQAKTEINQAINSKPNDILLLNAKAWLNTLEQQVSYFSHGKILDNNLFNQALLASEEINSNKKYYFILLSLLDKQHQRFNQQSFDDLPINVDTKLAYAEWLSQQQQFEKAQELFDSIERIFPAILWHYQLNHLKRWLTALTSQSTGTTDILNNDEQQKVHKQKVQQQKVQQQIKQLEQMFYRHFPALIANNGDNGPVNTCIPFDADNAASSD